MYNEIKHCFLSGWMIRGKLNISRQSFWEMKTAKIISTVIWKCGPMDIVLDGLVASSPDLISLCASWEGSRKKTTALRISDGCFERSWLNRPKEGLSKVWTELADVLARPQFCHYWKAVDVAGGLWRWEGDNCSTQKRIKGQPWKQKRLEWVTVRHQSGR